MLFPGLGAPLGLSPLQLCQEENGGELKTERPDSAQW